MRARIERAFGLAGLGTTVRTEVLAGATTFLTLAYIVVVNPAILAEAGLPRSDVMFATCVASGLATIAMGLFANYPVALAPGMGINAFFAYSVCLGMKAPPEVALACVLASGILFLALTAVRGREAILDAIPDSLKSAVAAGIGIFIAFIGLSQAGLVADHPVTLVTLGDLRAPRAWLALLGIAVTALLAVRRVPGAILLGIATVTVVSILVGASKLPEGIVRLPALPRETAGKALRHLPDALALGGGTVVFTFLFVGVFDTAGSLVGVARAAGLVREDGKLPRAGRALFCDAAGTTLGALLGTSTVVAYIESAAGVAAGGRSGLVAVVVGVLLLLSVFLSPLVAAIPPHATAPALVLVGALMMGAAARIRWDDPADAIPAFLTAVAIPLTYSVATGLALGFVTWPLLRAASGRAREVPKLVWVLAALFAARHALLPGH